MLKIEKPQKILVRVHFSPRSVCGKVVAGLLTKAGVRIIQRGEEKKKTSQGYAVKIIERQNLSVGEALRSAAEAGYSVADVHILKEAGEGGDKKTIVVGFAAGNSEAPVSVELRTILASVFASSFAGCRVYVNQTAEGERVDCVELVGIQADQKPKNRLGFNNGRWS